MLCYICSTSRRERPSVALCRHCLVGLCLDHLAQSLELGPGGMRVGCRHDLANLAVTVEGTGAALTGGAAELPLGGSRRRGSPGG